MSRVWSLCQTEEPRKQAQFQERPAEEARVGTRVSEEEASHCREGVGQKCGHGLCLVCLRDSEWGRLTGKKITKEKQGKRTLDWKCEGLGEKDEEFVFHSVSKGGWWIFWVLELYITLGGVTGRNMPMDCRGKTLGNWPLQRVNRTQNPRVQWFQSWLNGGNAGNHASHRKVGWLLRVAIAKSLPMTSV